MYMLHFKAMNKKECATCRLATFHGDAAISISNSRQLGTQYKKKKAQRWALASSKTSYVLLKCLFVNIIHKRFNLVDEEMSGKRSPTAIKER